MTTRWVMVYFTELPSVGVGLYRSGIAEAYINMSLSKEFQQKIDSVLRSPSAHRDVSPTPKTMELLGPGNNIVYADWKFLSENRPKLTEMWNNVFG